MTDDRTSNSLIQYLRVCADLAEAPGDDQDGLAYVSPIKLREAITEIERLTRENESLRAGRTNSQRVNDNGAQEIDRMRAALDETLEELQLDDSRHDLMAKIISALSGEPGSAPETFCECIPLAPRHGKFCSDCGKHLPETVIDTAVCRFVAQLGERSPFCGRCGEHLYDHKAPPLKAKEGQS